MAVRAPARNGLDLLAILGILLALGAVFGGSLLEGMSWRGLADGPALLIVGGGTLGAVILQTPARQLLLAWRRLRWILAPPVADFAADIDRLSAWGQRIRREGMVCLEDVIAGQREPFLRAGLQLVADFTEAPALRRNLTLENDQRWYQDQAAAQVFRSMGGYAPTIGMLGAVLGLIHVMGHLDEPEQLGVGIATAFVATIYGVGLANLVFLPVAERLTALAERQWQRRALITEGLAAIVEGEHPKKLPALLQGYLATD